MTAELSEQIVLTEESNDLEGLEPYLVLESNGIEVGFYEVDDNERSIINVQYAVDDERWNLLNDPEVMQLFVAALIRELCRTEGELESDLLAGALEECEASQES